MASTSLAGEQPAQAIALLAVATGGTRTVTKTPGLVQDQAAVNLNTRFLPRDDTLLV
jgi:hypothetical protein